MWIVDYIISMCYTVPHVDCGLYYFYEVQCNHMSIVVTLYLIEIQCKHMSTCGYTVPHMKYSINTQWIVLHCTSMRNTV